MVSIDICQLSQNSGEKKPCEMPPRAASPGKIMHYLSKRMVTRAFEKVDSNPPARS